MDIMKWIYFSNEMPLMDRPSHKEEMNKKIFHLLLKNGKVTPETYTMRKESCWDEKGNRLPSRIVFKSYESEGEYAKDYSMDDVLAWMPIPTADTFGC